MKNALRNLAVVITLIFTLNVTALAVTTNEKLQPQKDSLTKIQTEREEIEMKIEQFDNEIEKNMAKTEENKVKIFKLKRQLKAPQRRLRRLKKKPKRNKNYLIVE